MFKLLKGGMCYTPEKIGKKDILIAYSKICKIEDHINTSALWDCDVFDCSEMLVCPGFIDQHVHIIGGGGEEGPSSRIPEIKFSDIVTAGVTTLVGVLGLDGITRSISALLAKAKALEEEGITTYIYTGSYSVPSATLTGKVVSDITLIDKIIGIGEVAISDHRSSHTSLQHLKALASNARIGGLLGGKAGIMHIHVGDGRDGIMPILELLRSSDFPMEMFVPTHLNRNKPLFEQAINYLARGGNIDLTAGETTGKGHSLADAVEILIKKGVATNKVTFSSDGNGSIPAVSGSGIGVGKVSQLYEDFKSCVIDKKIDFEQVLMMITSNVARILKLYPKKGTVSIGNDADILVLNNKDLSINKLFARGELMVDNGKCVKKDKF